MKNMNKEFEQVFENYKQDIRQNLKRYLSVRKPENLWKSMYYTVSAKSKLLRPVMALECCRLCSGSYEPAMPSACAIEMLHSQSLIHDDLPCMDNDDYRRGQLSNHKVFGEAVAVLAGDALLSYGPQIIIEHTPQDIDRLAIVHKYVQTAGAFGLVGGQVADIEAEETEINTDELNYIHEHKTARLFEFAVYAGAVCGKATPEQTKAFLVYAQKMGLAFQISDDILDIIATKEEIGKTPGKDILSGKKTYPHIYGIEESKKRTLELCDEASNILNVNNFDSLILEGILNIIRTRIEKNK